MNPILIPGLTAHGDIASSQFRFVKLNADLPGEVAAMSNADAPELPIGVLMNDPDTEGHAAEVAGPGSYVKVEAGGSFDESVTLVCDNSGRVIAGPYETSPATANLYIIGISFQVSGGSGQHVLVLVTSPVLASTE